MRKKWKKENSKTHMLTIGLTKSEWSLEIIKIYRLTIIPNNNRCKWVKWDTIKFKYKLEELKKKIVENVHGI